MTIVSRDNPYPAVITECSDLAACLIDYGGNLERDFGGGPLAKAVAPELAKLLGLLGECSATVAKIEQRLRQLERREVQAGFFPRRPAGERRLSRRGGQC